MTRHLILPLLILAACAGGDPHSDASAALESGAGPEPVRPGVEVFASDPPPGLAGRAVGLITNHTGVDAAGVSSIDRLMEAPGLELVALYSPEHGIRGTAADGELVESGRDARTGLPIHSLYGETRKPTPEMLEGVEALIFDIQDIGARQYTYISTMALAMEAARERGIPFYVLDRPNPIGSAVEGNILDPEFSTFVGMYPIASRHGMTVGELALLFNTEFGIGADLTVIEFQGGAPGVWFDETGLPWVDPSPNIRRLEAAIHYPGTVFLEGTNLSEGRGTSHPFEQTGAPWLDAEAVVEEMNAMNLPGVRFEALAIQVEPDARKFPGQTLPGIRYIVTDREQYRPIRASLLLIDAIRHRHPSEFEWSGTMDRLAGTDRLRQAIDEGALDEMFAEWERDEARFREMREGYRLY